MKASLASLDLGSLGVGQWGLLVSYSLAASLFAVWMWVAGLKHIPANQAGVFTVALPIAATLVGVALLGERFSCCTRPHSHPPRRVSC